MIRVNENFRFLPAVYLFTQISRRVKKYREEPNAIPLIRMDIGDVPGPLPEVAAKAMQRAVEDLMTKEHFRGYGPEQGYEFLRETIAKNDYRIRGINISPEEIFVSDGAKCDIGNLGDILSKDCKIAVMNPSYPVYIDDNVIDGRAGIPTPTGYSKVEYLDCESSNGFYPSLPSGHVDVIYLCSPNNPTGTVLPKEELEKWVNYARKEKALIIFDSAYEAYIRDEKLPKSIYEIKGADEVAIEVRSYSKTGGFTGIRCGYSVVPGHLQGEYSDGQKIELNKLWSRRQTTKFNGASYISQRGAEALYTQQGKEEIRKLTDSFLANAALLREAFETAGWEVAGGKNSPYVWAASPSGMKSIDIFEKLLTECGVSTTPGIGFGSRGEGYIRLTGFNSAENTKIAIDRISSFLNNK